MCTTCIYLHTNLKPMKTYKLQNGIVYRMPYFCETNLKFYQLRKIATRTDKLGRRVATINGKVVAVDSLKLDNFEEKTDEKNNPTTFDWGIFE